MMSYKIYYRNIHFQSKNKVNSPAFFTFKLNYAKPKFGYFNAVASKPFLKHASIQKSKINQLSFHLVYKHKLKKTLVAVCQISCLAEGPAPWVHAMAPQLESFFLSLPLFCVRLKIASGLLQNKQFMDFGFDAVFAWRGQLSPACRKRRPHH